MIDILNKLGIDTDKYSVMNEREIIYCIIDNHRPTKPLDNFDIHIEYDHEFLTYHGTVEQLPNIEEFGGEYSYVHELLVDSILTTKKIIKEKSTILKSIPYRYKDEN